MDSFSFARTHAHTHAHTHTRTQTHTEGPAVARDSCGDFLSARKRIRPRLDEPRRRVAGEEQLRKLNMSKKINQSINLSINQPIN